MAFDLTEWQQTELRSVAQSGGYAVILDILEKICVRTETELLRMNPAGYSTGSILLKHAEARSARIVFETLQREVEYQLTEATHGK